MTEERKTAKRRRVEDAKDVVDSAIQSAIEKVTARLNQLHLDRKEKPPAIQTMIAKDAWSKVLPFLCMSDAVSAYQGGFLHVPRPWQMELNDTLVIDEAFADEHKERWSKLIEFWQHSKLGANVRVLKFEDIDPIPTKDMMGWIDCFHRLEEVRIRAIIDVDVFAHLIRTTAKTMRRVDIALPGDDIDYDRWHAALREANPQWTELRLSGAELCSVDVLPPTLTLMHVHYGRRGIHHLYTDTATLLLRCPVLVDFELWTGHGDDRTFNGAFAAAGKRNWVRLGIGTFGVTDEDIAAIGCASLRHLKFSVQLCTPLGIKKCLDACTSLDLLNLHGVAYNNGMATLVAESRAAASLTTLSFDGRFSQLEVGTRMILYRGLPRLSRLMLDQDMTDENVRELMTLFAGTKRRDALKYIDVDIDGAAHQATLPAVLVNSSHWEYICMNFTWPHDIDSKTMHWLAHDCKALTVLDTGHCALDAKDLVVLLKRPWRKLELLAPRKTTVPTADNVRIEDLRQLAPNASIKLEAVIISSVPAKELLSLSSSRTRMMSLLVPPAINEELRAISKGGISYPLTDNGTKVSGKPYIVHVGGGIPKPNQRKAA